MNTFTFEATTWPKEYYTQGLAYLVFKNGEQLFAEGSYLCGKKYKEPIMTTKEEFEYGVEANKTGVFTINNFEYNGFMGKTLKGKAPYTAKFNKWSGDPGVAIMDCSDGKRRWIPTFAINGSFIIERTPEYNEGILFGHSSTS